MEGDGIVHVVHFQFSSPLLRHPLSSSPTSPLPPKSIPSVHLACMPEGLVLTCHRRSHRCRPHRENSPPRGYPARGEREKVTNQRPVIHNVKKPNQEIVITTGGHNLSFAVSPPLHWRLHLLIPKRMYSNSLSLATALFLNSGMSHFWTQWIYLKSHSQSVLQTCNRNSSDCCRLCSRISALVWP